MADMEKGVRITKLNKDPNDSRNAGTPREITTDVKEDTQRYIQNMRARQYDKIPIKFIGKGPGGYMLYDWVHHKGRGSPKLS